MYDRVTYYSDDNKVLSEFAGEMIHSVKYKDVRRSGYDGKKVVLIGIGNSSVDIADNLVSKGG